MPMYAGYFPRPRNVDADIDLAVVTRNAAPLQFAGGQNRRVDRAVALIGDPELLVLDEPTTGFDPQHGTRPGTWAQSRRARRERVHRTDSQISAPAPTISE